MKKVFLLLFGFDLEQRFAFGILRNFYCAVDLRVSVDLVTTVG